ncbi:MAG TPA: hypothetical protein VIE15_00330 [Acidimicrobiales bacterium]
MSETPNDEERSQPPSLLDVVVFGPIDAAFSLLADPRGAATRGRARVDHVLRQARALGELSVRFGSREIRRRTEGDASDAQPDSKSAASRVARPDAGPPPDDVIADYDALSASQIVPLLPGLDADERARVTAYEEKARSRQTILRRLAQLDEAGG